MESYEGHSVQEINRNNDGSGTVSSSAAGFKRALLPVFISLKQGWQYFKAVITGQMKKAIARNEKEASEADLLTSKIQVEAADAAEEEKKRLGM